MLLTSSQFSPAGHSFGDAYLAACFKFSSSRPELSGAHSAGNRCPSFASRAHLVSLKSAVSQISRKRHTKVQTLVIFFPGCLFGFRREAEQRLDNSAAVTCGGEKVPDIVGRNTWLIFGD